MRTTSGFLRNKMLGSLSAILMILFINSTAMAHGDNPDFFQSIGKIYVVVTVVIVTFIGFVLFLIALDRRLKKLENEMKDA